MVSFTCGQHSTAAVPGEEHDTQFVLKLLDSPKERRLLDVQALVGTREM
jgi:hypothetical protein